MGELQICGGVQKLAGRMMVIFYKSITIQDVMLKTRNYTASF